MLSFEDFKGLAKNSDLTHYEKVGFGAIHRKENEANIFPDILSKLPILHESYKVVLDIGSGCSKPAQDLINFCTDHGHNLFLMDSEEQLNNLENSYFTKICCQFPLCPEFIETHQGTFDAIIIYSVIHHVFYHQNLFAFIDNAVNLLKPGGALLLGDLPNSTKKKRFLDSAEGQKFHQQWMGINEPPLIIWNKLEPLTIDDSVIFSILQRYRQMGCDTYLLPQYDGLPMNKTREDILIVRN